MTIPVASLAEPISIALGMIIVFITFRAGKLNSQLYLYYLSIGFGIISLGSLLEEAISHIFEDFSIRERHFFESIFVNIGLIVIIIALREVSVTNIINESEDFELNSEIELI